MATGSPKAISEAEKAARQMFVKLIADGLGFVGNIEYRHVYSQSGGAQYGRGSSEENDLLIVYAEAFERSADDFSLRAMIAHERGHQIIARHPKIAKRMAGVSLASEEILASLLGAMITDDSNLYAKAMFELIEHGQTPESADRQLRQLWRLLEQLI
jgi:hypothetical protein